MVSRTTSDSRFIESNTKLVGLTHLKDDCIIPAYSKDNEPSISHHDFVQSVYNAVQDVFYSEEVLMPSIRVSHPIRGRIPDAKSKAAKDLLEAEKTLYYERMMFLIEIPSVFRVINGQHINLAVGGVRSYHQENLNTKRSLQKFKVFVGFRNRVCCNLCISTDGYLSNLKAGSMIEIAENTRNLLYDFEAAEMLDTFQKWGERRMSKDEFARFLGYCRLLNHMPTHEARKHPKVDYTDHQMNLVAMGYFSDKHFSRYPDGSIDLWKLYNLLTGANKASYIDKVLDRSVNALEIVNRL